MRIAHVCSFYEPVIGGVKQVVKELALRQLKEGHDVHVFTSDWDKYKRIKKRFELIDGIKVHRCFHWFRAGNFGTYWSCVFWKILFGKKFDVIHSHVFGNPYVFFSALAGKIRGSWLIHTTHCPWSDAPRGWITEKIFLPISYNTFSKWSLNMMDKVVAITHWEDSFIEKYGGKGKIANIPNGMSSVFFDKIGKNGFKKKWGIPENDRVVLFFGRLNTTKNPDFFVEIGKEIIKERNDVYFVLRGPDEGMKDNVSEMVRNEERMMMLDETRDRKEIAEMYQACDVYALPSYREGLPLTLFEAMASGLPVVASPVNGVPYEMKDGVNGFLVDWRDREEWKKAILKILDDKKLAEKFRKNNIKKAREYDWDKIAERVMGVYTN